MLIKAPYTKRLGWRNQVASCMLKIRSVASHLKLVGNKLHEIELILFSTDLSYDVQRIPPFPRKQNRPHPIRSILGEKLIVVNAVRQLIPSLRHVLFFTHAQSSKRARARELHSFLCHCAVLCSLSVLYLSSNQCLATPGARDGSLLKLLQQPRRSEK